MNELCIYHSADLDGECSAAIVERAHPGIELHGWNYGDPIPWEKIEEADRVWLVDLSFQPWSEMERLYDLRPTTVWIDHHKSAIADERASDINGRFPGIRSDGCAGCELTWNYLYAAEPMPKGVYYLGRWDVWAWQRHPDRRTMERFQFGMRSMETMPCHADTREAWSRILDGDASWLNSICSRGSAVLDYRDEQNRRIAASAFETEIDDHRVLALNAGGGSTIFDSVWKGHLDCVAMLSFTRTSTAWRISLYSDRGFDCSVVAREHGGGGHAGAAGFTCTDLPFELSVEPLSAS